MKKLAFALAAVAAIAALPATGSAQQTGIIDVTANVQTVLDFGTAQGLSFGAVTPGTAATGTGYIPLSRNVGAVITLPQAANLGVLTRSGGTETLTPAYTCGLGATSAAITTPFASCTPATGTTVVATLTAPAGLLTEYVIFNGSLTAAQTNTTPGTYTGTIEIVATQN